MWSIIGGIVSGLINWGREAVRRRQELNTAIHTNRVRLAMSEQTHNQAWEMAQLKDRGWKDDVLFYAWLGFFIWCGVDPAGARPVIEAWESLPEWFLQVTFWIVAAVLGVRQIGTQLPATIQGVRDAFRPTPTHQSATDVQQLETAQPSSHVSRVQTGHESPFDGD